MIDSKMLIYFLCPKTTIRVLFWIKFFKKFRIKRKNTLGSDNLYQIKEIETLFHPIRYNLMSENTLNQESNLFVYFYYFYTFSY